MTDDDSALSARSEAVTKAVKDVAREVGRTLLFGAFSGVLLSISGTRTPKSQWSLNVYQFRAISVSDGITWSSGLLGLVVALNLAVAATPSPHKVDSPVEVAARYVWAAVVTGMMRLASLFCVGIAVAENGPHGSPGAAAKALTVCLAAASVVITATLVPLSKSRDRALYGLHISTGQKHRLERSARTLERVLVAATTRSRPRILRWVTPNGHSRKSRVLGRLVWFLGLGVFVVVVDGSVLYSVDSPRVVYWPGAMPDVIVLVIFAGAICTGVLVLGGVGISARWAPNPALAKWAHRITFVLIALVTLWWAVIYVVIGGPTTLIVIEELTLLVVFGAPMAALWVAHRWQAGPAVIELYAGVARWRAQAVYLEKEIAVLNRELTAHGASS